MSAICEQHLIESQLDQESAACLEILAQLPSHAPLDYSVAVKVIAVEFEIAQAYAKRINRKIGKTHPELAGRTIRCMMDAIERYAMYAQYSEGAVQGRRSKALEIFASYFAHGAGQVKLYDQIDQILDDVCPYGVEKNLYRSQPRTPRLQRAAGPIKSN